MAMELAIELELDDDVFFADISKQLNLLITDEDEQTPISLSSSSVSFQGLLRESYQTSTTPFMMYHEQNQNLIRESKGTGVFIPRRKHYHHPNHKKRRRFSNSFISKQQFPHYHHVLDYNNNQESTKLHHASTSQRRNYRDTESLFTLC